MPPTRSERFGPVTASSPSRGSCARTRSTGTGPSTSGSSPARSRWAGGGRTSGRGGEPARPGVENITQILWPSDSLPELRTEPRLRAGPRNPPRELLGDDAAFDFDMLIDKAPGDGDSLRPGTRTAPTGSTSRTGVRRPAGSPSTKRPSTTAACWFVPGSHRRPMRPHRPAGKGGGALECDGREAEGVPVPIAAGSCTFHHGATMHYSRGNSTSRRRRALIVNFRPRAMVELERARGFDHGKDAPGRGNRKTLTR